MTALFVVIFVDQWRAASSHLPAIVGAACALVFLLLLGADSFLLPALITSCALLLALQTPITQKEAIRHGA